MGFNKLEPEELAALGKNIRGLEQGLMTYWRLNFPRDPVELVYVIHFFESKFEKPLRWHMHIHIIPRFKSLTPLMPYDSGDPGANAWKIPNASKRIDFPQQYKVQPREPKNEIFEKRIRKLMAWLGPYLGRSGLNPDA